MRLQFNGVDWFTVADTGHWLIPAHFPTPTATRITFKKERFSILP